jgi:hypothetical protein
VRTKLPHLSDTDAIVQAVQDGFTTKSKPRNKGIGLHHLLKCVTLNHGGHVTFYSHQAIVRFEGQGTKISPTILKGKGYSPGTTIDICLRTDAIKPIQDKREDLEL